MELDFTDGIAVGLLIAIITRAIVDWWRSRYVIIKRTKLMQDYAEKDVDLTLGLYPPKEDNYG
jgi:hypothetical protein